MNQLPMLPSSPKTQNEQTLKSHGNKHYPPNTIEEIEEVLRLKTDPVEKGNAGSAEKRTMSKLNAATTNDDAKRKRRKQHEKGTDTKELTDEMRTDEEIEEMIIDTEETVTEIRRTTPEKGRDTATNRRWTKKPRNQQGGTPTLVLPST